MITPWEVEGVVDYERLMREFGIRPFSEILDKIPNPHPLMRRGVIFGHRDYERIVDAMKKGEEWAVMSGFMPSGLPHLGHKMTMDEIVWHQNMGGKAFMCIADMEARFVRGLSVEKTRELGELYIRSIIALGLKSDNCLIYYQSANRYVKDLAIELSSETNFSELRAVYGFNPETSLIKMFIPMIQAGDILHPQLKDFGGFKPVVVPVGADQDPHLRLTRDLANRICIFSFERIEGGVRVRSRKGENYLEKLKDLNFDLKAYEGHVDIFGDPEEIEKAVRNLEMELGGYAFIPPSSTYHKFTTGLRGGKMSSSKPESYISLFDKPEEGAKKVMRALTGGRATVEEQRRLGGEPDRCVVFELYTYHFADDKMLEEIRRDCEDGNLLCGQCKKQLAEIVKEFLKEFQEKAKSVDLSEFEILK
ncbi:tryptophan--tRNA ligase [Archaeoglobus profundus]|uniref:Tryptophan--tRNA ligase n=1 Tax=Archaeoglobus profundus (strain DSM 5631 / JCM 9629 / NBRC 100127 / Av18) TaxID=572546 RepID=D2RH68_ARCPA|nr:tryptophan--tRNA ligase [Archaeoglobus profundus]ADB57643.1 tryptophanyl-tRNA synthetase [Archaeoglobus profundus DSM 5631]